MDPAIWAGIIGAIATIMGALIPLLSNGLKRRREMRRFKPISKQTAKDLSGNWVGFTEVRDDREPRQYRASITFIPKARTVSGKIVVTVENPQSQKENDGWHLLFLGGFIKEEYLQLDYWHPNQDIRQFGSIIYELKNPRLLEGRFVAMGRELGRMIYGEARLWKP
jgi:hypothetical protein